MFVLLCFIFNRTNILGCSSARTRLLRVHSRAVADASDHTPGAGRHDLRSYLQIIFGAEHVRVSDADASEGHRDEDRSARLPPAVIAKLQRHPGRQPARARRTHARSVAREAGVTTRQPFRVRRAGAPGVPSVPRARPCGLPADSPRDCLGRLVGAFPLFGVLSLRESVK